MHIPDGFVDAKTWMTATVVSGGTIAYAAAKIKETASDKQVPLMGVVAAFIFAAQMINFPVAGGTSGHFLGAALAAIFLGPWAAILIMSTVLIVQLLFFADGGVTALGANIFNMGIAGVLVAYWSYTVILKVTKHRSAATFAAAWLSVVTGALLAAIELAASGTSPLNFVIPAMLAWHAIIGIGEGVATTVIVTSTARVRPDLLNAKIKPDLRLAYVGITASLLIAGVLSPFASGFPDGLERVARDLGFSDSAAAGMKTVMTDYAAPGVAHEGVSTAIAGVFGVIVVLAVVYIFSAVLPKKTES